MPPNPESTDVDMAINQNDYNNINQQQQQYNQYSNNNGLNNQCNQQYNNNQHSQQQSTLNPNNRTQQQYTASSSQQQSQQSNTHDSSQSMNMKQEPISEHKESSNDISISSSSSTDNKGITQRDDYAKHEEELGSLTFEVVTNDGTRNNMIDLIECKNIFSLQLPKMPKEYITRLVLDRNHRSLCIKRNGKTIGRSISTLYTILLLTIYHFSNSSTQHSKLNYILTLL